MFLFDYLSQKRKEGFMVHKKVFLRILNYIFKKIPLEENEKYTLIQFFMRKGFIPESMELLKIKNSHEKGKTIAHALVSSGLVMFTENDTEILNISDDYGWTVAHEMAISGYVFKDIEKLRIADENGWTVAHALASCGHIFKEKEVLKIRCRYDRTVAHIIALENPEYDFNYDLEILTLKTSSGESVAHVLANRGHRFPENRKDILYIKNNMNRTVAHEMAEKKYFFSEDNIEILSLEDKLLFSVASFMARNGYEFPMDRFDILLCSDPKYGCIFNENYKFVEKDLILENIDKNNIRRVLEMLRKSGRLFLETMTLEDADILFKLSKKYRKFEITSSFYKKFIQKYELLKARGSIFSQI